MRAASDARIRIDGKEGWTFDTAREMLPGLLAPRRRVRRGALPCGRHRRLHALPPSCRSASPVYIDEGCKDSRSIPRIATYAEGINIKLAKAGGIREALRMVRVARAHGLGVMIGCMIESAASASPARSRRSSTTSTSTATS